MSPSAVFRTRTGAARAPVTCALLACAALLAPARARAQEPVGARAFCLPGGTGRCFAFAINDATAGFDVWLRNLSPGGDDVADPFRVQQFGLRRVNARDAAGRRTDLASGFTNRNVVTTGTASRGYASFDENTSAADFPAARNFDYTAFGSFGLLGCAAPPPDAQAYLGFVAVTCAERGLDGWLRISYGARVFTEQPFALDARPATSADVAVQVAGCTTHLGAASGVEGAVPGTAVCESSPFAPSVVPEPGVVWLVAAGGAGLWLGVGARRRARARPGRVRAP